MKFPLYIVQVLLLILWFAVPTFAAVPWWVIWLPTLVILGLIAIPFLFAAIVFGLVCLVGIVEALFDWNRRRRQPKSYRFTPR